MKYKTKQEVLKEGLIKKNNIIYKRSILEVWYDKGWLDLKNSNYSAEDRLRCGLKLAYDYYVVSKNNLHSGFIENTKVDIGINNNGLGKNDIGRRYFKAIESIPSEFWPIVRRICIEDKEPEFTTKQSERQIAYQYYLWRTDLCRGLDRLISFYN